MLARLALSTLIVAGFSGHSAFADGPFTREADVTITIGEGGRLEIARKESVILRSPTASRLFVEQVVPISRSESDVRIENAVLEKKDGRVVPLSVKREGDALRITAPEPGEGDRIAYTLTMTDRAGSSSAGSSLAGGSYVHRFPANGHWGKVNVVVKNPGKAPMHHVMRGLTAGPAGADGRLTWQAGNMPVLAAEPNQTDPVDTDPFFALSTFADDAALGREILRLTAPEADDPEIMARAKALAGSDAGARDVVASAYRHVVEHLADNGGSIDETRLAGEKAVAILARRNGNARDFAHVFRSLLAARGIVSEVVLANLRPIYAPIGIPHAHFDHMLVHVPSLGLYVDPSRRVGGLGDLAGEMAGKDVFIAGAGGTRRLRLDAAMVGLPKVVVDADLRLTAQGHVIGEVMTEAHGSAKALARLQSRLAASEGITAYERKLVSRQNLYGQVSVVFSAEESLDAPLRINASIQIFPPREKDHSVRPAVNPGPRFIRSANFPIAESLRTDRHRNFVCEAQHYIQRIRMALPDYAAPVILPQDVRASAENALYRAQYRIENGVMIAERELRLDLPSAVCTPQQAKAMAHVIYAASRDANARLVLRGAED